MDSKFEGEKQPIDSNSSSRHQTLEGASQGLGESTTEASLTPSTPKPTDSNTETGTESMPEAVGVALSSGAETDGDSNKMGGDKFSVINQGVVSVHVHQADDVVLQEKSDSATVETDMSKEPTTSSQEPDQGNDDGDTEKEAECAHPEDIDISLTDEAAQSKKSVNNTTNQSTDAQTKDLKENVNGDIASQHLENDSAIVLSTETNVSENESSVRGDPEEHLVGELKNTKICDADVKEETQKEKESPKKSKWKSDTSALFQNLKRVAAQNSNVLENITRQMEIENAFESDDDDTDDIKGLSSLLADLKKDTEALATASEENTKNSEQNTLEKHLESEHDSKLSANAYLKAQKELSPRKKQQSKTNFNHRMLLKSPGRQKSVSEGESDQSIHVKGEPSDNDSKLSSQDDTTNKAGLAADSSLINLDLFIQGNSEIVLLLLMEKGSACHCDTVRKLVRQNTILQLSFQYWM